MFGFYSLDKKDNRTGFDPNLFTRVAEDSNLDLPVLETSAFPIKLARLGGSDIKRLRGLQGDKSPSFSIPKIDG